jgi:hypothetical protein
LGKVREQAVAGKGRQEQNNDQHGVCSISCHMGALNSPERRILDAAELDMVIGSIRT